MTTFEEEVQVLQKNSVYGDHVHKLFFTISNKDPTNGKVEELKKLIGDCALKRGHHIPTRWFRLLQSLKEKVNGKTTNWLSLKNAKAKAIKDVHIDVTEIEAALLYFHGVGEVVYFSEIPDMIVIEPTWLFQELTKIITIPSHHEQIFEIISKRHWDNIQDEALLHQDVLEYVWPEDAFKPLVVIMKKYALLLPVPADYKLRHASNTIPLGNVYLVPSLLPLKGSDETHQAADTHEGTVPPVTLVFPDNFIPVGLTSRLITALCNEHKWKAVGQIFKDAATFKFKKGRYTVIETSGQITVGDIKYQEQSHQCHQGALQTISETLKKLSPHQDVTICISCPECQDAATFVEDEYLCQKGHHVDPSPYQMWLNLEPSNATVSLITFHKFVTMREVGYFNVVQTKVHPSI